MDLADPSYRRSLPRQHGFESLRVEGKLPPSLCGTLYRNGPGCFEGAGQHPLLAPGVVAAVRLQGGAARGACRVVQPTPASVGDVLHPANTHVVPHAGRLLALNEGRSPVELSPDDLSTLGEFTFGGALVSAACAHPHRIAASGSLLNVGVEYGKTNRLHLYELPAGGAFRHRGSVELPWAPLLHDFALTERHLIAFVSPLCFRPLYRKLELGGMAEWFQWQPERGSQIVVIPLAEPSAVSRWNVEPFFQWHFVNAFERGSELIVDYVRFPDAAPFVAFPGASPWAPYAEARCHRAVLNPLAQTLSSTPISDVACDFPRIDPRFEAAAYRRLWALEADLRGLSCIDSHTGASRSWRLPEGQSASEPLFVPEAAGAPEGVGHVLSLCFDRASDASFLAILDASHLEDGPVASVWFDHYVPALFHGSWLESPAPLDVARMAS